MSNGFRRGPLDFEPDAAAARQAARVERDWARESAARLRAPRMIDVHGIKEELNQRQGQLLTEIQQINDVLHAHIMETVDGLSTRELRAPGGDGDALTGAKLRSIELQLKAAALQGQFRGQEAARDLLHEAGVRALNERLAQRE